MCTSPTRLCEASSFACLRRCTSEREGCAALGDPGPFLTDAPLVLGVTRAAPRPCLLTARLPQEGRWYDIETGRASIKDGAWFYPTTKAGRKNIENFVTFSTGKGISVRADGGVRPSHQATRCGAAGRRASCAVDEIVKAASPSRRRLERFPWREVG